MNGAQHGDDPNTGRGDNINVDKAQPLDDLGGHLGGSSQLTVADIMCNGIALKHAEAVIPFKGWNPLKQISSRIPGSCWFAQAFLTGL